MTTKLKLNQVSPTPPSESETTAALNNKVNTSTYNSDLNSVQGRLDSLENLNISSRLSNIENNYVTTNTTQTLTGTKTFQSNIYKSINLNTGIRPISSAITDSYGNLINFTNSYDNKTLSFIYPVVKYSSDSNWVNTISLLAYDITKENSFSTLGIGYSQNGVYTFAPTPSTDDNSTKIATTAYVKDCVPKSVGDANTPVYTDANGVITSTGKSFANYSLTTHTHNNLAPVSGSALPTGNLSSDGLQLVEVYNNGYPTTYGNVINVQGSDHKGAGQLLLGWSGSNNGIASIYYRNKRDNITTWSDWKELSFADHTHSYLPIDSPAITGTPTAPTAAVSTNNTQIATTAFVKSAMSTWNAVTLTPVTTYCTSVTGNFAACYQNPYLKLCTVGFNLCLAATTIPSNTAIVTGFPKALHHFGCALCNGTINIRAYISTTGALMLDGAQTFSSTVWVDGSVTYPYSSL